jgi:hypothetical protein
MNPNPQLDPQAQQPGWFSKNWKWLVGGGCLSLMLCCGGFSAITFFAATKMIQSSGAYAEALAMASQNPEVSAALGSPLTPGFGMSGSVNQTNDSGSADFTVPVNGSKGEGKMHVVASRSGGVWKFETIDVVAGGKTINVLAAEKKKDEPPPEEAPDNAEPPDEPDGD